MPERERVRVFTVEEANTLLPGLRRSLGALAGVRNEILRLQGKLEVLSLIHGEHVSEPGNADYADYITLRRNVRGLVRDFNRLVTEIRDTGAVLKDPAQGLVDFYGRVGGDIVFLCWQASEDAITHWHPVEGGFATRQPLGDGPNTAQRDG